MIRDVGTVVWKELRELFARQGSVKGGVLGMVAFAAIFGVYLPWTFGRDMVSSPMALLFWAWVPLLLVMAVVVDSFAGERERHTLETLLASRLSDRSILYGKILTATLYGWGLTMFFVVLGLITVNVAYGHGQLLMFSPFLCAYIPLVTLLACFLTSSAGVLASLRAPTVRQASTTLSMGIMVVAAVPFAGYLVLPGEWTSAAMETVLGMGMVNVMLAALAAVAALSAIVLLAATARFKRQKLMLD